MFNRPFPYASGVVADLWVKTKDVIAHPTLTQGNPWVAETYGYYLANGLTDYNRRYVTGEEIEHFERWKDYIMILGLGDNYRNDAVYNTDSSLRPRYRRSYIPTKILIRELK